MTLPWLGLGLSSNMDARERPNPYRVADAHPGLIDYVEYSAPLEIGEARRDASLFDEMFRRRSELPVLFHPVHLNLYGPELESAKSLHALNEHAIEVGSPWVGNDVAWWHRDGRPVPGYAYLAPPFDARSLEDCAAHALHVQSALDVPLALENPAVIAVRGSMHVLDFMAALHARTGLPLILDVGHLWSDQLARKLPRHAGFDGFPFDAVIELHIAGGELTEGGFYVDDHTKPVRPESFDHLAEVLPRCRNLRALTFEGDGHAIGDSVQTLKRLRAMLGSPRGGDVSFSLLATPEHAIDPRWAWELFDSAFAGKPVDATHTAERDFRLMVLAQQLDRRLPLSRLLAAGEREDLARFAASPEFRGVFDGGRHDLIDAFARWARRRALERRDEVLAMVLAYDLGGSRAPHFPADLSAVAGAAAEFRRRLHGRGWPKTDDERATLEALRQGARTAAAGALNGKW